MGNPLRILIVEDSADDAELIHRELHRGGCVVEVAIVDNASDMKRKLSEQKWDAVIADYSLPNFGALAALYLLHEAAIDIPFIVVSGTVGEEIAVEAMKAGAHDYLMKNSLKRLVPAIERELREAESRRHRLESEEALRRSQKQYQNLVDSIEGIVWEGDAETRRFLFVSPKAESLTGYPADRWLEEEDLFIRGVHEDDRGLFLHHINNTINDAGKCDLEYRFVTADGKQLWIHNLIAAAVDNGKIKIRGVMTDVSRDKRAEEALRISEEKFSKAFRSSPQSIVISSLEEGRYIEVNDTFLTMTGYKREEIIGRTSLEINIWPSPEDRKRFMSLLEERGVVRNFETNYRHITGDYGVMLLSSEIIDLGGEQCLLSIAADITERKKAEDKILNIAHGVSATTGEEFFRSVVEHISETLEADYAFVGELCDGQPPRARIVALFGASKYDNIEYVLADTPCEKVVTGKLCSYSSGVQRQFPKDDMLKELEIEGYVGTPLFDSKERVLGLMVVLYRHPVKNVPLAESILRIFAARVASELERGQAEENLRKTAEQLRQAQKMEAIGRLAGGVAHDFNNLLTAIIGYAEVGMMRLNQGDPLRSILDEIIKAGERASTLTSQLLAFSRKQMLQMKVLDLNNVVSDMERMLKRLIGEDIDLVTRKDNHIGRVSADRGQIEQVLMNLVINSRDAMPKGGILTVETANMYLDETYVSTHVDTQPGHYVMLAVTDTGHGMDADTLTHIFEPFFTTKSKGQGTGLGLSTVYGIIKQSGGDVWVYSEQGRGTTFKIYLPQVEQPEEDTELRKTSAGNGRGSETVLVVEDEDMVRRLTCQTLTINGYQVLEAPNPGTALLICEQHEGTIDLLVTDVVMPQMNGRELSDRLTPLRPGMKVLYMSGYTDSVVYQQMDWNSGLTFIQKPFSPHTLLRKVRELLDKK
jgi:PAS domain S-box-containing protein